MLLDKTLLLKGVAGVAAVGGVVWGGIAAQKGGLFSSSSKNADAAQPEADTQVGGQGENAASSSLTPESTEDDYGIPKRCNDSPTTPCDLSQEELKKIKFEVLGEETEGEVKVEGFPDEASGKKISLTIDSTDTARKKYIFSNGSTSAVTIKRGDTDTKKVTLKLGKTKFTLSGGKLKEKELGEYGEPKDCTTTCNLYADDLEDIKFKDLDGGTGDITVTPTTGTVSLEIKEVDNTKRYIFTNSSGQNVTISKGNSNTVTLTSNKKTQFTADSDKKLSKLALDNYGIPTSCTSTCNLTADDLGEIKFEELGGTGTVSSGAGNVTLKVDSSDGTDKRFTFDNTSGSAITIQKSGASTPKVTLSTGKTRFKTNSGNDKLKEIKLNSYGLPNDCTQTCKLTADDLKEIKFKDLEEVTTGTITIEPTTPNPQITLTITAAAGSKPKIYTFKNSSNSAVTLKKGSSSSEKTITLGVGDTEFKEEGGKLVPYEDPDLKAVNEKIENTLKLPSKCKFEKNEKSIFTKECDVTVDDLKKVEFENKENGNLTITGINGNSVKLGIRRLKKEEDKSEYDSTIKDGDLRVIFKNTESRITISGSNNKNIIIPKKSNKELRVDTSNKLANSYPQLNNLPTTWRVLCADNNNECSASGNSVRIFSGQDLSTCQEVSISSSVSNIFTVTKDTDDYNQGFKFTVKGGVTTSPLSSNDNYEIKYSKTQKKWGFVKKSP